MTSTEKQILLDRIRKLRQYYLDGKIKTLAQHEVNPGLDRGSRENYLYFTLAPCLNFQRSSPALWASALKTYSDPKTRYLFFPEKVAKKDRETIQQDLLKYKLALQPNKHTDIWTAISQSFYAHYKSDPRELIKAGNSDVSNILEILQKTQRKDFPYLSGPKLSNYWLYILSHYTDIKLKNMNDLSIIPDTHVLNCTLHLGLSKKESTSLAVVEIWKELLKDSGIFPVEMHAVLWNWSRNNFQPNV